MDARFLRNFAIIAHIDHGKSTLSDRLLELTGAITEREMQEQMLDDMDLERERGITIKAYAVRMMYTAKDGKNYKLNLIDTPGHVDFSYEVRAPGVLRRRAPGGGRYAGRGSADAGQRLSRHRSRAGNHPRHQQDRPALRRRRAPQGDNRESRGPGRHRCHPVSAKTGQGVDEFWRQSSSPAASQGDPEAPLQALIFDSWFDAYRGVIVLARVIEGNMRKGQHIRLMSNGKAFEVDPGRAQPQAG